MKFRLHYRGRLPSNGGKAIKCEIRNALMAQLNTVWEQLPLNSKDWLNTKYEFTAIKNIAGQKFSAIVNKDHFAVAEIDILFLRPEPLTGLVDHGGDIDNRMKTLLDALSIPNAKQLSSRYPHTEFDGISHCLLEDDKLISRLNIEVDRLLDPQDPKEVLLVLSVRIRRTKAVLENLNFAA